MATAQFPTAQFLGTYHLDRAHSSVDVEVRHMQVSTFRASFADIEGQLTTTERSVTLDGRALAESISISDPPEFREHVVRGAEFFAADAHPLITFRSTDVHFGDAGTVRVSGELTIRGVSRSVSAHGTYRSPRQDPYGGRRAGLELHATLDRRDWGMDWQMPLPDGSDALGWEVDVTVRLELVASD